MTSPALAALIQCHCKQLLMHSSCDMISTIPISHQPEPVCSTRSSPFRNVSAKGALCRGAQIRAEPWPVWMQYYVPTQELDFIFNCFIPGQPYNWGPLSSVNKVSDYYCFTQATYHSVRLDLLSCSDPQFRMVCKSLYGKKLLRTRDTVY